MFFSIVVPLYNKSYSIKRCIDSILLQSHSSFEIIIVNDGSTDDSLSIVRDTYASEIDSEIIKIIDQPNQGVSAARNKGVNIAKSDYICFLDADDEWKPSFLEEMYNLITDFPEANLYCLQHETKVDEKDPIRNRCYHKDGFRGYVKNFFKASLIGSIANSSKICISKSALDSVGGFPESYKSGEDLYVWMEMSLNGSIAFYNKVFARVNVLQDLSRSGRSESIPYPFIHYSGEASSELNSWSKVYLFKMYLSHFAASLRDHDMDSAKARTTAASGVFPYLAIVNRALNIIE
ncbi:glycosyltransferase family 2 protein [Psychrobacter pacificensis]|uniref:glycosyltransferase family 2 protein n=1 Tax=Psychrobacter pacificensis TaxID=112002 RepID=UPI003D07BB2C